MPLGPCRPVTCKAEKIRILNELDGFLECGQLLLVLGRPGSGCSTLLKTLAGEMAALTLDPKSVIHYGDIPFPSMHKQYRGKCIYCAEHDIHFPELTVNETLQFAAKAREEECAARLEPEDPMETSDSRCELVVSSLNLTSASNTKIGNAVQRGVSGGEKRRATLGEVLLSNASVQCWDNSIRGMDSATAYTVMKVFRANVTEHRIAAVASLYQASQAVFDLFDCIILLYDGEQIFFGTTHVAVGYFTHLGFDLPPRTSVADYLTALTNPAEARRFVREGVVSVPQTKMDFVRLWRTSSERHELLQRIGRSRKSEAQGVAFRVQSKQYSNYTTSLRSQVTLCINRCYLRTINSISIPIATVAGNAILALIIGGLFLNLDETAASVTVRSNLLFISILLNGFMSGAEVFAIWDQRPIVEKHARYALYHPMAESIAALLCDLPVKLFSSVLFNVILYLMANLRRSVAAFFTYWIFAFVCHVTLSTWFRSAGSFCKTLNQLTLPLGIWHLALITYSGYVIPVQYMRNWLHWIRYLNPMTYAFESMIINEFEGRKFPCREFIPAGPAYDHSPLNSRVCAQIGTSASVNETYVDGSIYLHRGLGFEADNLWRNLGVLLVMMFGYFAIYLLASEFILASAPGANVLRFPPNSIAANLHKLDEENQSSGNPIRQAIPINKVQTPGNLQTAPGVLYWRDLSYDIPASRSQRQTSLLTNSSGLVEPGTLTALMGATGAGKTTLLDVLAGRVSTGTISGQIAYQGMPYIDTFRRRIGFVQQQDIHLSTSTVREALHFSAMMRWEEGTLLEKTEYVEEVIRILDMAHYADAMIGTIGQGLNVEQLRRLSIGVELVAKPDLLFLDEPTSGLDSQTAWSVCSLLQDLARHGQAIICTLHQPSVSLFEMFDKLLLIQKGGETIYYGDIGHQAKTVTEYFRRRVDIGDSLGSTENPADWIFNITSIPGIDWSQSWKESAESSVLHDRLGQLSELPPSDSTPRLSPSAQSIFAIPLLSQIHTLIRRMFTSYWRTPQYLWCNLLLSACSAALISVSCPSTGNGIQGLKTQLFAVFLFCTLFSNISHQLIPNFVKHRELFETREGRSRIYSWRAFITSILFVEAFWMTVASSLAFVLFYFPMGFHNGRSGDTVLAWLYTWAFFLLTSTLSHLLIAGLEHAEAAANYGFLLFYLCLIFCGVLVPKSQLSRFWIFLYRVSPLTYVVAGLLAVGMSDKLVHCTESELLILQAPDPMTCGDYLASYLASAGGRLLNPDATAGCQFCPISDTTSFLATLNIKYSSRWEYLGYIFVFVAFNIGMTFMVYWVSRAPNMVKRNKPAP
ncbi:P-loop containing nucleoside triphosphate hydrolase protein [Massariosphaeria phaeospora]|uniref:P-loop containing nucleoside triphosphate hydrolase protein n=1 Tax=Massariosphaeria phaeospora TaxID=100035 RepID=A0A7C8MZ16_9PLEO|nr:P-loop containing nucleoside triphosphate hydrolase protein [Massariosphaeria phaeospora]